MFSKTIIAVTLTALFATSTVGAAVAPTEVGRGVLIAQDAVLACNCLSNCQHKNGDSCAYYFEGNVRKGSCGKKDNKFQCIG